MPSVPLHPPAPQRADAFPGSTNPLPQLLRTPSGLAILELQGTINMPTIDPSELPVNTQNDATQQTAIGSLVFPDYDTLDPSGNNAWTKRVYLYVGQHQRLTGEVKKLPKPMAVIRRRDPVAGTIGNGEVKGVIDEELEIVEIVRWKILFSSRPEPVGG
ncbi:MAG: hypothetical protein M1830_004964 [Pleopsidium flavum]|nr:MAG: hypothetical protein M1830_004964 [Pleopsidium flavum]